MKLIFIFQIIFGIVFNFHLNCSDDLDLDSNLGDLPRYLKQMNDLKKNIIVEKVYKVNDDETEKYNVIDDKSLYNFLILFYEINKIDFSNLAQNQGEVEKNMNILIQVLRNYDEVKKKVNNFLNSELKQIQEFDEDHKYEESPPVWNRQYVYEDTLQKYLDKKKEGGYLDKFKKFILGNNFSDYEKAIKIDFELADKIKVEIERKKEALVNSLNVLKKNNQKQQEPEVKQQNQDVIEDKKDAPIIVVQKIEDKKDKTREAKEIKKENKQNKQNKENLPKKLEENIEKKEPETKIEKQNEPGFEPKPVKTYFNDAQRESENKETKIKEDDKIKIEDAVEMIYAKTNDVSDPEKIYEKIESDPELKARFEKMSSEQKNIFKNKIKDIVKNKIESVKNGNFSNKKIKEIYDENKSNGSFVSIDSIDYASIVSALGSSRSFFNDGSKKENEVEVNITDEDKNNFKNKTVQRTLVLPLRQQINKDPLKREKLKKLLKLEKIAKEKNISLSDLIKKIKKKNTSEIESDKDDEIDDDLNENDGNDLYEYYDDDEG
jgi:hypothetical protein